MSDAKRRREILESPEFWAMAREKNRVSLVLTALILAVYFGFIAVIAFAPDLLVRRVSGSITLGIPVGIGVIAAASLLTGAYVRWANRVYDRRIAALRRRLEEGA